MRRCRLISRAVRVKVSPHKVRINILLPTRGIRSPEYQFSHIAMATASEDVPINHMFAKRKRGSVGERESLVLVRQRD